MRLKRGDAVTYNGEAWQVLDATADQCTVRSLDNAVTLTLDRDQVQKAP